MSIKKVHAPIVELLQAAVAENAKVKVTDVIDRVLALASAKVSVGVGNTFLKDASGAVVAIRCYYFKRWMPLVGDKAVEFGKKANTPTGLNTMCKEGTSHWTKQQRAADDASMKMLERVKAGELSPADIGAEQVRIEEARKSIAPTELGFASEEEVKEYLASNGITLAA